MSKPRFAFTYGLVSIFADRVRLGCFVEMGRFKLVLVGQDPAVADLSQAEVSLDLPKNARAAYQRAAAAFNEIMDEHERAEALKRDRRRAQSEPSVPAVLSCGSAR